MYFYQVKYINNIKYMDCVWFIFKKKNFIYCNGLFIEFIFNIHYITH